VIRIFTAKESRRKIKSNNGNKKVDEEKVCTCILPSSFLLLFASLLSLKANSVILNRAEKEEKRMRENDMETESPYFLLSFFAIKYQIVLLQSKAAV
jgi:hypothetical protein